MIRRKRYFIAIIVLTGFSGVAYAHGDRANGPCKPVLEACQAAGKTKSDAWHCVKEFQSKGTVEGVEFSDGLEEEDDEA